MGKYYSNDSIYRPNTWHTNFDFYQVRNGNTNDFYKSSMREYLAERRKL